MPALTLAATWLLVNQVEADVALATKSPGIILYEPQTFLSLERYVHSLAHLPLQPAIVCALVGAVLCFYGLPLRRIAAALVAGGFLFLVMASVAMIYHQNFALFTWSGFGFGALVGLMLPRIALSLTSGILLALGAREASLYIDPSFAFEALVGAFVVGTFIAFVAHRFFTTLETAILGAVLMVFALPGIAGGVVGFLAPDKVSQWAVVYGGLIANFVLIGLAVQSRTGETRLGELDFIDFSRLSGKKKKRPVKSSGDEF